MLKLIRNAWEHRSVIKNSKGEIIDWMYIKKLYELEKEQGLRAGTRLTKRHVNFHNDKMNVRLAAQTLSQSVADALTYLKNTNEDFKEAGPTIEFISFINYVYDILNSRSRFSKSPFKRAISDETLDDYKIYIQHFIKYVKGLQFLDGIKEKNWICWFHFGAPECNKNVPKFTFKR
uniref:THAP domain-containing protein 9 n=1 Tax=Sipha flava TaxID=143950 RepID=A0A2S2QFJ3_9HEMI